MKVTSLTIQPHWMGLVCTLALVAAGCARAPEQSDQSQTSAVVEELGVRALRDVDRIVRPAILRSQTVANDERVADALRAGDTSALTALANELLLASHDLDVIVFFDTTGRLIALSEVYADGRPVPRERVAKLLNSDLSQRPIVANCLRNDVTQSALEFQTQCDITPAYFDSQGLSVAYSTPVVDSGTGEHLGVVSARLDFARLLAIVNEDGAATPRHGVYFVTDDGQYFSEQILGGAKPPIPQADLAGIVAPVVSGGVERSHADLLVKGRESRVTVLPLQDFETISGGGLSLLLIADREWIDAELVLAGLEKKVLWGSTVVLTVVVIAGAGLLVLERKRRRELARARDAAEASERAKSTFLAHMSHEIRTPLTAILGFSESITQSNDVEEIRDCGATILRNGQSLLAILDDILDLSKIEADRIELRRGTCVPRALAEEVASLFEMRSRETGVPVELLFASNLAAAVETDALRVRQILSNLLSNALKFTSAGRVTVNVATRPLDKEIVELEIAVTDTGVGIAPADQNRLFQPFIQAESGSSRRFGGTGLGLVISRRFAELLGGTLELESRLGHGSTFRLRLPTRLLSQDEPLAADLPPAPLPANALDGQSILVVDDGADNRRLIGAILRRAGADVHEAGDGQAAIDAVVDASARGDDFDAVLMDVQMPGLDGLSATRELVRRGYQLPIVAVSAGALDEERRDCFAAGAAAFISKPIDRRELITETARVLHAARLARAS